MNKFKIIVPFYNVEQWISTTVDSILSQTYKNYDCYFSDDLSTDGSSEFFNDLKDEHIQLIKGTEKKFALRNIVDTIQYSNPQDDDIIVLLDGDDWFSNDKVLESLDRHYQDETLMTYGTYVNYPYGNLPTNVSSYPDVVIDNNIFRRDVWRASHLRTFKYKLWKSINIEDLKDSNGDFYRMAWDLAIMFPMLEMSGYKTKYINEVNYCYNNLNPLNDHKVDHGMQVRLDMEIRNKKPYERIF